MRKWLDKFSPLAWRLVAATIAFSTLVAVLTTVIQLYLDYRHDLGAIESTLDQVDNSYLATIANDLWSTNRDELQVVIAGLARLPHVQYLEIRESGKISAVAGSAKTQNILSRDYVLTHVHRGKTLTIGTLKVVMDMEGIYKSLLEKFWIIFFTNGVKTFLVAGFMLWLFHWLVTRHLQNIAEFSARLTPDNLHERLTLDRPVHTREQRDEFDLVVEGLTRMQSNLAAVILTLEQEIFKLEQAEDEIYRLNSALERRVIERTAQLEAVNRELEAFSYSVSHDLRTPLRSIDGFSQALLEDYGKQLDEVGHDYLNRVRRAAQRMGLLIDDLLRLARITRTDMNQLQVDLGAMAHEVIGDLHKYKGYSVAPFRVQEGLVGYGDPGLLRIVLENILDNAWKYSSKIEHPLVEFGSVVEDGRTVYFVSDNGIGFDMVFVGKLFGAFQRLHRADEFPGTGVGLATVKRIIHRHGGEVWAEGASGKGAIFKFTLNEFFENKPLHQTMVNNKEE